LRKKRIIQDILAILIILTLSACSAIETTDKPQVQTDAYIRMFDGTVLFLEDVETISFTNHMLVRTKDGTTYYVAMANLMLIEYEVK
jgi:uncharacterized lipoprotein